MKERLTFMLLDAKSDAELCLVVAIMSQCC